ncbi:hypothetical protein PC110_g18341 [Phytophthora cactorum]|uniref:Uncharacterized protein n=2 Tax=Phytophthora cactorum TaxID=29920 RepID=A0A329RD89_9STRA|nr:hypothetical protein PC110_g21713 [Phytophthora cactorum]RAW24758.1 hypothetical protein PC110_g18824 [Phytophthora cactorum]RAW25241.1 hypothetical protein PC110_g18341 [Phytophthora cactorum]
MFDWSKNSKQLSTAWDYLVAETYRIGGQKALKHMLKQYTVYRVPFRDTGNDTEVPLSDPRAMRQCATCGETLIEWVPRRSFRVILPRSGRRIV